MVDVAVGTQGVRLGDHLIGLDADRDTPLSFLSSARAAQLNRVSKLITTQANLAFLYGMAGSSHSARGAKLRRQLRSKTLVVPYRRPFSIGELDLELLPSGFHLGAAALLITYRKRRILYTGAFSTEPDPLTAQLEPVDCDILILRIHPTDMQSAPTNRKREEGRLLAEIRRDLASGKTPLLLCDPISAAQRLVRLLAKAKLAVRAHRRIVATSQIAQQLAPTMFPSIEILPHRNRQPAPGEILLWPRDLAASSSLTRLTKLSRFSVSGPADSTSSHLAPSHPSPSLFRLSDQSSHRAVATFVQRCAPREVVLLGARLENIATQLRRDGQSVTQLADPVQLSLQTVT